MRREARKLRRAQLRPKLLALCLLSAVLQISSDQHSPCWSLALVGDVMLGRDVARALDGSWAAALADVQTLLFSADLAFGNLESPLTAAPYPPPRPDSPVANADDLRAPPDAVAALEEPGFDVMSLANNHALDGGPAGLLETISTLQAAAITALPHGTSACLALPAETCWLALDDSASGVDMDEATATIAALDRTGSFVVVSVHWGGEYQAAPSPRQQALAATLVAAGADLIVGHGPHVLQRIEWIGHTAVLFSLGNLLFDQSNPKDARQGAIVLVTIERGEVVSIEAVPTVTSGGRVELAEAEDALAVLTRLGLDSDGAGRAAPH
ncbi:MAG: CapA family protein [Anaerolineales bacterium]|nr:MAG: CapA family protein [Anaerolineales bacterium]